MERGDQCDRLRVAGPRPPLELLRLASQMLKARTIGKTTERHHVLLSERLASASPARREIET